MTEKKLKAIFWSRVDSKGVSVEFRAKTQKITQKAINHSYISEIGGFNISNADTPQILGEEENDSRIEYTFVITDVQSNEHLVRLINFLLMYFKEHIERSRHEFTCSLVILSKEFFDVDFCSAQMLLPTKNFSFNNILDRANPVIHRLITVDRDPHGILSRFFSSKQMYSMLTDFEHDRRQMILRFPYTEKQRREYETGKIEEVDADFCVTLTVRYKAIRRIMVNLISDNNGYLIELYFNVSSPPLIRRIKLFNDDKQKNPVNLLTKHGDRFTAWDKRVKHLHAEINESPVFKITLYDMTIEDYCTLLSRLCATTERFLEFRTFSKPVHFPFKDYTRSPLDDENCLKVMDNNFKLMYMFEALLSRGALVKDYLLASLKSRDEFVELVSRAFREDKAVALEVLERVLNEIDEKLDGQHPSKIFKRILKQVSRNADTMRQLHEENSKEGYVRVRKVVITPTRMIFVAPELLMGNRVLRMNPVEYPLEKFIRVVFRDDDNSSVHANNVGKILIQRFIGQKLLDGIMVAGRRFNYFGSSNSQLRDNGCYFIQATLQEIEYFRTQLGSFKIQSAPKMMSRLGQCFTQARETGIELRREYYADDYDYENGQDSAGKAYCFSDGVGTISLSAATEVAKELGLDGCVPSCYQIRFRGFKGVLSVDKAMDSLRNWGIKNQVQDNTDIKKRDCWLDLCIKFRPSQKKFAAKRDNQKLEIVKYSSPVSICLNRPVINILDQVSSLQSHESHQRICNRIHYLMDMHLHLLTRSLMDEQKARNKLNEFPKLILYDQITDLNLTKEPFFRGMVRASVRATLKKLRQKLQIPIPNTFARAMFGVVDESRQLQHGQVFVRYTKNAFLKLPGPTADRVVLTGPVLITKNPSIVSGDIRMFEAVDIPCLHHLCDVVVFPCHGPRPHTDEMAGSDLDGDEYTIIWDQQLYLDHNEDAFDYTSKSHETITTNEEELRNKMAEFFVDYIKQDSIGRIANAFLINSDLFGIKSKVCMKIAEKHMEAVDFPKTGVPPKPLETGWDGDNPPERAERTPDFMEKNNEPTYVSSRLNGQLFRRAKEIDDILSLATHDDEFALVPLDPLIDVPGSDDPALLRLAAEHYEAYAANIQSIMDCYGIKTEGELFSGYYTSLRNRISDKDNDDMSFYNTSNAIEQKLFGVFGKFRRQFYETSLSGRPHRFEDVTTLEHYRLKGGIKETFRRVCIDPSDEYQQLACAYYKTAYDSVTRKLLSFPWLAWDVINIVRRTNSVNSLYSEAKFSFDPLSDKVTQHIKEYISNRKKSLEQFLYKINNSSKMPENEQIAWKNVSFYCKQHLGLDQLLFFTVKWAKTNNLFIGCINELHICLLLIQFGLNHLPCESVESISYWLEFINVNKKLSELPVIDLEQQHGSLGKKFMIFLEFLASRQFEVLPSLDFMEPSLGYPSYFYQKQWVPIHKAALFAFHQIAFTFRFDALPATSKQRENFTDYSPNRKVNEAEPFIIEVPASHKKAVYENRSLLDGLCQRSGCTHIVFRPLPRFQGYETVRLFVSVTGTMESINNLRSILSVRPILNLSNNCRQMSSLMAAAVYEKLSSQ